MVGQHSGGQLQGLPELVQIHLGVTLHLHQLVTELEQLLL